MAKISMDVLLAAVSPGGPSCLTSTTELGPAGGPHTSVAPARFAGAQRAKEAGVYAYERRYLDREARPAVIIDSKQSQLNRAEIALQQVIDDGHEVLANLPHVTVTYDRSGQIERYTDLTLPHRVFDGHVRAGTVDGTPTTQLPAYRAVRDATPGNARPLLDVSPITLVFGGWDSSRNSRQGRWRSALVGEIIGFCADRGAGMSTTARRGGARVDPVGMQVQLGARAITALAEAQRDELSAKTLKKVSDEARKMKPGEVTSASMLGLGGIPPSLEQLAGVACERIIRTHVLSFATLRQMRFGAGADGDVACRALLAALALNGLARSDAELYLRANCDLVEAGKPAVMIDQRGGEFLAVDRLDISAADDLLAAAVHRAKKAADLRWSGVALAVTGNPDIVSGAVDAEPDE